MIRVGVVAPALAVRAGLRALLQAPVEVVYEAANLAEFEPYAPQVDVLVVAIASATPGELRQAASIQEGRLALLLLGDEPQAAQGLFGLPLRAWGILSLDSSADELTAAVRALDEGLLVGSPVLMRPAFQRLVSAGEVDLDPLVEPLTERESQVLQLLARGLANKQIAAALGISDHTVKFHVSSIYAKLDVTSRTEAVRRGVQRGLVLL